ncbi:hypothetical protein D3C80_1477880 [compost metagenome]
MLESCRVRFAGFGSTGTHTALKISVLGHDLAFHVPDAIPQQPARNDRTKTVARDNESPFASVQDHAGEGLGG